MNCPPGSDLMIGDAVLDVSKTIMIAVINPGLALRFAPIIPKNAIRKAMIPK
jgi:hypothetical protein